MTGEIWQIAGIWGVMFVVFYFFLIRPQMKRDKARKALLNSLEKGQKVVTVGGIYGTIVGFKNEGRSIKLKIDEKVIIEVQKDAISSVQN